MTNLTSLNLFVRFLHRYWLLICSCNQIDCRERDKRSSNGFKVISVKIVSVFNIAPAVFLPASLATLSLSSHSSRGPRHLDRYVWILMQSRGKMWLSTPTRSTGSTTIYPPPDLSCSLKSKQINEQGPVEQFLTIFKCKTDSIIKKTTTNFCN